MTLTFISFICAINAGGASQEVRFNLTQAQIEELSAKWKVEKTSKAFEREACRHIQDVLESDRSQ